MSDKTVPQRNMPFGDMYLTIFMANHAASKSNQQDAQEKGKE